MSYHVLVSSSGHEFTIEKNETVLDAALRQGIGLPYGCRNGACGKCAGDLVSGQVEYEEGALKAAAKDLHEEGKALFCQAMARSDLDIKVTEITKSQEVEIKTLPCRVESMELLTHDIMKVELKLPENERMQFLAGQYLEFILNDGKRRAFSIANAPHDDDLIELHIRHVPDGHFGDYVFSEMKVKTLFKIEGPLGSYYLREESNRPVILVGGGTGFAPLKGMLEHAFKIGFDKPIHLFCGVRAMRDLYMDKMVKAWLEQHPNLKYTAVLSQPEKTDNWQGKTGHVSDAVIEEYSDLSGFDIYLSGPPAMVKSGMDAFYARGLPETQIYSDSFEYSDDALKSMGIQKPKS
ncbi:MAG: CDP-6-deoxy-delta-3,4-glucoseen reductase [Gammaproteobacteria bacterium]|nr:CDP-6-deoxy-delta-3,4-glucoseen reductase [Gammaproteobacteria bacterium]